MIKKGLLLLLVFFTISVALGANVGATLVVPAENATQLIVSFSNPSPVVGETITIYADYEDLTNTDVLGASVNVSIKGNNYAMTYSASDSAYVYNYLFTTPGTYVITITADKIGYVLNQTSQSISVSTPSPVPGVPAGGIGGQTTGSIISLRVINTSGTHFPVIEDEQIVIFIDSPKTNFQKLVINAKQQILFGTIEITPVECGSYELPENQIKYQCLSVTLEQIKPEQYSNAELYFRVSKSWITAQNINVSTIALTKFSPEAEMLGTEQTNEDDSYYYFYVTFDKFSNFVIHAEKNMEPEETIVDKDPEEEIKEPVLVFEECCLFGICGRIGCCWYWWLLFAIILGLCWYYHKTKVLPKKEKKEKIKTRKKPRKRKKRK